MKLEHIPQSILDANRQRGHSNEQIERMSAEKLFVEYCEWHGLVRWGRNLFDLAVTLHRLEQHEMPKTPA